MLASQKKSARKDEKTLFWLPPISLITNNQTIDDIIAKQQVLKLINPHLLKYNSMVHVLPAVHNGFDNRFYVSYPLGT